MEYAPSITGWDKLLRSLGKTEPDDEPLPLLYILELYGIDGATFVLPTVKDCPKVRLFAVRCVRRDLSDLISADTLDALNIAERYAVEEASDEELEEALCVVEDAEFSTLDDNRRHAERAALNAMEGNVWGATHGTAWCVANTGAVQDWSAAWDTVRFYQEQDFRKTFCTEDKPL